MIDLPLEFRSGKTLLAELTPEHYITDKKKIVLKLVANTQWVKPVERIASTDVVSLSNKDYDDALAPWLAIQNQEVAKHLSGQHDQASHGRKGPIKSGFKNWNSEVGKLIEAADEIDASRGNGLQAVVIEAAGFNGKPQVLSQAEFDAIESETIYRGVTDPAFIEDYKNSTVQYAGTGVMGNGTYTTNVKDSTINYTNAETKQAIAARTMEMKLLPDANVLSFDSTAELKAYADKTSKDFLDQYKASGKNPAEVLDAQWNFDNSNDWTNLAIMNGVDAIRVNGFDNPERNEYFTIILNRGRVAINNG